jgi:hypothetical protein
MTAEKVKYDDLWLKASVIGGLWASMEIIVGSFLHNTRLPFAGSILAFAGTILMIGFYQLWPQKGLIIRAGFITALMKSVSPSAIILGPMTGIFLEAALIELVLLLLGNNLLSVSVAGILSLSSALFHKIISVVILYGFDIIKVYVNIINFALKQFGVAEAQPVEILKALLLVYFIAGILAGITGYYLGKRALLLKQDVPEDVFEKGIRKKEFFEIISGNKTSIGLLWVHIFAIPLVLFIFNFYGLWWGAVFSLAYIVVAGYRYRNNMRRVKKPVFWSQLIIILVLSTFFWNIREFHGLRISREGFMAGVEMMIRAMFIIVAFTALSVELRNEKVKRFLERVGVGKFYDSVRTAFGALPEMITLLPTAKEIIRKPVNSMLKPMVYADSWLEMFKNR